MGIVNRLTQIISENMEINMESISVKGKAGMFSGEVVLVIKNKGQLKKLVDKIKEMDSVINVTIK